MDKITATYFKAHCLRLLDEVAQTREPLVVTKHGKPVARIEPPAALGDLEGTVTVHMTDDEFINATMGPWEVEGGPWEVEGE